MEKAGLSRNTVKKALNELLAKQLITETASPTNRAGALYDLNIQPGGQKSTGKEDAIAVEYQDLPVQTIKSCQSRLSNFDPTKERKESKKREVQVKPASPSLKPLPQETDLPSEDNSPNSDGNPEGRRCTDPVILAYIAEHVDLFSFEPQIAFAALGGRLKQLRKQFSDDQIIGLVRAAKQDTKAWYRRDKDKEPTYDLLTILSINAINQIRRNHPSARISRVPKKPRDPCPVCGSTNVLAGGCAVCHFDLRGDDRTAETISEWRLQAIWRGVLEPRNEQEKAEAEAWSQRRVTKSEEQKKKLSEVAA
jgi:hypothetical protein